MADGLVPVTQLARAALPTRFGEFEVAIFEPGDNLAIFVGAPQSAPSPLVRLHSECLTGDVLGSERCDCGEQLEMSLKLIQQSGAGVLLYLRQEGRGIGLANKIRAYALQDGGLDTVDANLALGLPVDGREYASAAAILHHLGLTRVRLLTNNPRKSAALEMYGIEIVERVPLVMPPNANNLRYLRTKADRLGHLLAFER
jgi:3,4-dihydroxy 2-butanone 4-phosphate synthase/GTP cyclohydrolase II